MKNLRAYYGLWDIQAQSPCDYISTWHAFNRRGFANEQPNSQVLLPIFWNKDDLFFFFLFISSTGTIFSLNSAHVCYQTNNVRFLQWWRNLLRTQGSVWFVTTSLRSFQHFSHAAHGFGLGLLTMSRWHLGFNMLSAPRGEFGDTLHLRNDIDVTDNCVQKSTKLDAGHFW